MSRWCEIYSCIHGEAQSAGRRGPGRSVILVISLWIVFFGALPGDQPIRAGIGPCLSPSSVEAQKIVNHLGDRDVLVAMGLGAIAMWHAVARSGARSALFLVGRVAVEATITWLVGRPRPEGTGLSYPKRARAGSRKQLE